VEIPEFKMEQVPKRSRGAFSENEWEKILKKLDERIDEIPEETQPETKYQRKLFKYFMMFMAATGLRPGEEPRNLKWKHIESRMLRSGTGKIENREINEREHILIKVKEGKTGERIVIAQPGEARTAIEAIRKIHPLLNDEERLPFKNLPNCEKYLWVEMDGKPIRTFKNAFSRLKKSLNMATNSEDQEITLYSLRHFYATRRLYDLADPLTLAKNMGTSVQMIYSHYDHILRLLQASQLTGATENEITSEYEKLNRKMFK
jgi:integrase